jgi:hypothetical protein
VLEHLQVVYQYCPSKEHGLRKDDLAKTNRKNAQRLYRRKVITCLQSLQEKQGTNVKLILSTKMYLSISVDYIDFF